MSFSMVSILSKATAVLALSTLVMTIPLSANAGFLDSIYNVQNTISSIGRTADTIRGSKQAVSDLGEEVGFTKQTAQGNTEIVVSGSMLFGKLKNTSLYSQANKTSTPVAILSQQDTMIYMGAEKNGYYYVQTDKGEGWVSTPLVGVQ